MTEDYKFFTNKTRNYKPKMLPKIEKRSCKCLNTHEAWYPLSLYAAVHILDEPPPSPNQLRKYLIDGPFLNQKTYKYSSIVFTEI